jgi:hypothetical protein
MLEKQQEEFQAWQRAYLADWLRKGPGIDV